MKRTHAMLLLIALGSPIAAYGAGPSANQLLKSVIANEIKTEQADHSHWMLKLETQKPNKPEEVDEVVETKDGDLQYPIQIDGRAPSEQQRNEADSKLQQYTKDPTKLRKSLHDQNEDEQHSQRMLKLLPQAFLFQYGERQGSLVELKFRPNPKFHPPNREAEVFHAMEGSVWVDSKQKRLARIQGHLTHEVKFGGGVLGHLDPGGDFDVKQEEVAPGFWELTALNVQMKGKALFFKTISVQQKYTRSQFKRVSDNLSVAEGVKMLRQKVSSQAAGQP